MYEPKRFLIDIALGAGIFVLAAALILPSLKHTNCGGNSAALSNVRQYMLFVRHAAAENPDRRFSVTTATPEQREQLARLASNGWVRGARFLVSNSPFQDPPTGPRRVIMVCDTPFTNVPRRIVGSSPPTHAASFSDGSTGLLSVTEFLSLDRSTLTPLDELLASSDR